MVETPFAGFAETGGVAMCAGRGRVRWMGASQDMVRSNRMPWPSRLRTGLVATGSERLMKIRLSVGMRHAGHIRKVFRGRRPAATSGMTEEGRDA